MPDWPGVCLNSAAYLHLVQSTEVMGIHANHFIADNGYVVVGAIGQNVTLNGKKYENKYRWVCCIVDEKIHEVREYMDTDLVTRTFSQNNTIT